MTKAIIVEDEQKNISVLKKLISDLCPNIEICGTALDAESGYKLIQELKPALVFLDIEMPYGSGFDLLERLKTISFEVIFVTAYNQYALKAFKYNSVDYLLKPIDEQDLVNAVKRAEDRIRNKVSNEHLQQFLKSFKTASLQKVGLPTHEGYVFIDPSGIIRCEADGAYTNIFYGINNKLMVSKNLKEMEPLLDANIFCRVHHSHIVNLNFVKKYFRGKGGEVEMEDGSIIQVSARKKSDFLEKYNLIGPR